MIDGDPAFFRVTKRLHNMLHGFPGDGEGLSPGDAQSYRAAAERNARALTAVIRRGDLVLPHDPQTAGLVAPLRRHGAQVVWRCHVGVDSPNDIVRRAWSFLLPHVSDAERLVFSRAAFCLGGPRPRVRRGDPPSIDAFTPKNQPLPPRAVESILRAAGIHAESSNAPAAFTRLDGTPGRVERAVERNGSPPLPGSAPAVVQVSRWDRLEDPPGVLRAFADEIAAVDERTPRPRGS